jgi:primosomal protein N' (replication factor Y)
MIFVRVAVNLPLSAGLFDYHLPPELEGQVQAGSLVVVPFGHRDVQGVVWRVIERPEVAETKAVRSLLDPLPALTPAQLQLADWLSHETLAPLADCFDLMLPPGLSQQSDTLFVLSGAPVPSDELNPLQARLHELLARRGELRGRQIDAVLPRMNWRPAAQRMVRRGWLASRSVLPPPTVQARTARTVRLALPLETALEKLGKPGTPAFERRQSILVFLAGEKEPVEAAWALAAAGGEANPADLHRLNALGLIAFGETESWRDPLERMEFVLTESPELTAEQNEAWERLLLPMRAAAQGKPTLPHLLHGITGSGKTEIYLQAVAETLRLGRQAIILVPEISLTPQTVRRFAARFPGRVGLVHSRLSPGERYDTWRRARDGKLPVIIGARSALFTPLPNLGLIIIDEFHEDSYYQSDLDPSYHAVSAALALARLSSALILLGSATPDITLFERARREGWPILRLPVRILAHRQAVHAQLSRLGLPDLPPPAEAMAGQGLQLNLPPVKIVDMRQELKAGNRTIFSRALQEALDKTLANEQQAILFLNRRGSATYVFCRDCGTSVDCPRCEIPLTFHESAGGLTCHTCGYRRKLPVKCPACASAQIRQFGLGTERVEAEVRARYPQARVLRWDAETAAHKDAADLLLANFSGHHADILVGTQMIAKGLDLPLVTLVGVILADVGLQLPDFRAGERAFQLLTQVAGRAGRSPLGGSAIFQTYKPDHYALQAASRHDFEGFMRQELAHRRKLGYPPYSRLLRLELRDPDPDHAAREAARMGQEVQRWIEVGEYHGTELIGPAPCFFARRDGLYRWQILLRGPDPAGVVRGRGLGAWRVEVDPLSLL